MFNTNSPWLGLWNKKSSVTLLKMNKEKETTLKKSNASWNSIVSQEEMRNAHKLQYILTYQNIKPKQNHFL